MKQLNLFDTEPEFELMPDADRTDPIIWIRRLVIVDERKSDTYVRRNIEFRRGLNIIQTDQRTSEDQRSVGHDVGKTLLTRLIRYVLGEKTFATEKVRKSIQGQWPSMHVIAQVFINGDSWIVVRPLGHTSYSSSWAARGDDWQAVLDASQEMDAYDAFVDALSDATVARFVDLSLQNVGHHARWLDLLAWLSRDQHCAFRSITTWRDKATESGTAQLQVEDANLVIRMALDLLDTKEQQLITHHRELLADKGETKNESGVLKRRIDATYDYLSRHVELDESMPSGSLFVDAARNAISTKKTQLERLLEDFQSNDEARDENSVLDEAIKSAGVLEGRLEELRAHVQRLEGEIQQRREADDDTYFSNFGSSLPCDLQECPRRPENRPPNTLAPEREARIGEIEKEVESLREEIATLEPTFAGSQGSVIEARKRCLSSRREVRRRIADVLQALGRSKYELEQLDEFQHTYEKLDTTERLLGALEEKITKSLESQEAARDSLKSRHGKVNALFDYSVKALMNDTDSGHIALDGHGLRISSGDEKSGEGEAYTAGQVLSMDWACMLASISGIGHLPRFLIHDSPRAADREIELHYQLFNFVVELESRFGDAEPSFQYIVTTTTPPPKDLAEEPYVREILNSRTEDGLLLKSRF